MKKNLFLILFVVVALIVDGTMTYDIFEFRKETAYGWTLFGLCVILVVVILMADNSKKSEKEDNSE